MSRYGQYPILAALLDFLIQDGWYGLKRQQAQRSTETHTKCPIKAMPGRNLFKSRYACVGKQN
jgi:hypothetical protein